jgi:hypothetical protein
MISLKGRFAVALEVKFQGTGEYEPPLDYAHLTFPTIITALAHDPQRAGQLGSMGSCLFNFTEEGSKYRVSVNPSRTNFQTKFHT